MLMKTDYFNRQLSTGKLGWSIDGGGDMRRRQPEPCDKTERLSSRQTIRWDSELDTRLI